MEWTTEGTCRHASPSPFVGTPKVKGELQDNPSHLAFFPQGSHPQLPSPLHPLLFHNNKANNNFGNSQHFLMLDIVPSALHVLIHLVFAKAVHCDVGNVAEEEAQARND